MVRHITPAAGLMPQRSATAMAPASAWPQAIESAGFWRWTPWIALMMLTVSAVRLHELVPGVAALQPALISTFGGLGACLLVTGAAARRAALRHPLVRLGFAYWAFMILTVPFALWPGLAFGSVRYFLPGVALLTVIMLCRPTRRSLFVLHAGMVAATTLYAVYAKLYGRVVGDGRLRAGLGMYDSNDMAALLALSFPLAVGLARAERGPVRLAAGGAAAILVAVILASGSRGGLLALAAGAVVLVLGIRGAGRIAALAVLAAVTLGLWSYSPSFQERVASITHLEDDYNLTDERGRKAVWQRGRQYIRENPVVGVGVGNFPIAEGAHFSVLYYGTRGAKWSTAHNAYVQAYAELGLIGGSLFVALLLLGVRFSWRMWRGARAGPAGAHRPEFLASLAAFMMGAVFLSHAYFLPLFALLGIIGLAHRVHAPEPRPVGRMLAGRRAAAARRASEPAAHGSGPARR
jgi:O-antigen ligase